MGLVVLDRHCGQNRLRGGAALLEFDGGLYFPTLPVARGDLGQPVEPPGQVPVPVPGASWWPGAAPTSAQVAALYSSSSQSIKSWRCCCALLASVMQRSLPGIAERGTVSHQWGMVASAGRSGASSVHWHRQIGSPADAYRPAPPYHPNQKMNEGVYRCLWARGPSRGWRIPLAEFLGRITRLRYVPGHTRCQRPSPASPSHDCRSKISRRGTSTPCGEIRSR